jgi:PKD repeat protein
MGSYISASLPVVIAGFTATPSTGPAPLTVQFTNTSVNANTYLWLFGTGSLSGSTTAVASSSLTNPTHQFWKTGSFIVTLQASGSYNQYASTTSSISASV